MGHSPHPCGAQLGGEELLGPGEGAAASPHPNRHRGLARGRPQGPACGRGACRGTGATPLGRPGDPDPSLGGCARPGGPGDGSELRVKTGKRTAPKLIHLLRADGSLNRCPFSMGKFPQGMVLPGKNSGVTWGAPPHGAPRLIQRPLIYTPRLPRGRRGPAEGEIPAAPQGPAPRRSDGAAPGGPRAASPLLGPGEGARSKRNPKCPCGGRRGAPRPPRWARSRGSVLGGAEGSGGTGWGQGHGPELKVAVGTKARGTERLRSSAPCRGGGGGGGRRQELCRAPGGRAGWKTKPRASSERMSRAQPAPKGSKRDGAEPGPARCQKPQRFSLKTPACGMAPGRDRAGQSCSRSPSVSQPPLAGEAALNPPGPGPSTRLAPGTAPGGGWRAGKKVPRAATRGLTSSSWAPAGATGRWGRRASCRCGGRVKERTGGGRGGAANAAWPRRDQPRGHGERGRSPGEKGWTPAKGYLAHVSAQRGHHPARVPLHPLHQAVVPRAARRVQRRVQGALRGGEAAGSDPGRNGGSQTGPGADQGVTRNRPLVPRAPRRPPSRRAAAGAHLEVGNAAADLVDVGQRAAVVGAPAVRQPQLLRLQLGREGRRGRREESRGGGPSAPSPAPSGGIRARSRGRDASPPPPGFPPAPQTRSGVRAAPRPPPAPLKARGGRGTEP